MKKAQKEELMRLRALGCSYSDISAQTLIPVGTIKSFFRRRKSKENVTKTVCKNCGKPITQTAGRKEKKFCSGKCRMAWWNTHQDKVNRKAYYKKICACCGKEYIVYAKPNSKFCSVACSAAYRRNKAGGRHD